MSLTMTDIFCGGGGSSTGGAMTGTVKIVMAANHNTLAVNTHQANHPDSDHACVDLHIEDPRYFPRTDILWASPECTRWSQAGGSRNGDLTGAMGDPTLLDLLTEDDLVTNDEDEATRSRLLMFDVLRFIDHHHYSAVIVENVVDIAMRPKYRRAWEAWQKGLTNLGYDYRVISLNSMHAQALGAPAPQSRDRLYVVAWPRGSKAPDVDRFMRPQAYCPRCDRVGESFQAWKPGKSVGKYRDQYVYLCATPGCATRVEPGYLPAAAAIDWTLPGKRIGDRAKPLAEKTIARIAAGIARYWGPFHLEASGNQYDAADPKHPQHGDPNAYYRTWPVTEYLRVLHTQETKALAIPVEGRDGKTARPLSLPARTQTCRNETAMLVPSGGTWNDEARPVRDPHRTLTTREHMGLLAPYYSASDHAQSVDKPIGTLTTVDRYALIHRHNTGGAEMTTPTSEYLRTLTTAGHQSVITPGDVKAAEAQIDDCLFRMLEPHEVAAGMAFPPGYDWHSAVDEKGRPATRRSLVRLAGNAVTPPAARDLIAAVAESLGGAA
ncbi:DNA cytosine methyltransferase [Nocardioides terrisoli]|uniref:DNA cytosine methyltransferase n=1 Tax=Nocardioides terrisoli TaxID=3388267 RepID=UPI00287B7DF9|nr:DNA cytosine methyltransferase [Nocardioides marmorisolisilvae]